MSGLSLSFLFFFFPLSPKHGISGILPSRHPAIVVVLPASITQVPDNGEADPFLKPRLASDTTQTDRCDRPLPRFLEPLFGGVWSCPSKLPFENYLTLLTCMQLLRQYVRILRLVPFFFLPRPSFFDGASIRSSRSTH